jgi:hypothetical protein
MKLLDQDFAFVRSETAFAVEADSVRVGRNPHFRGLRQPEQNGRVRKEVPGAVGV